MSFLALLRRPSPYGCAEAESFRTKPTECEERSVFRGVLSASSEDSEGAASSLVSRLRRQAGAVPNVRKNRLSARKSRQETGRQALYDSSRVGAAPTGVGRLQEPRSPGARCSRGWLRPGNRPPRWRWRGP